MMEIGGIIIAIIYNIQILYIYTNSCFNKTIKLFETSTYILQNMRLVYVPFLCLAQVRVTCILP